MYGKEEEKWRNGENEEIMTSKSVMSIINQQWQISMMKWRNQMKMTEMARSSNVSSLKN